MSAYLRWRIEWSVCVCFVGVCLFLDFLCICAPVCVCVCVCVSVGPEKWELGLVNNSGREGLLT